MKKITLIFAALFVVSVAQAVEGFKAFNNDRIVFNFNNAEPIAFIERGIAFYVFMNGEFDFNTESTSNGFIYRQGRGSANGRFENQPSNFRGVRIEHDNMGRVRRVGNVFINYDFQNRIKRIGSVTIFYNRFSLAQVGGLRLIYNRFGEIVDTIGSVNGRWNSQYGPNNNLNFGDSGFGNSGFDNNNYYNNGGGQFQSQQNSDNDDDYLYKKKSDASDSKTKENPAIIQGNGRRR